MCIRDRGTRSSRLFTFIHFGHVQGAAIILTAGLIARISFNIGITYLAVSYTHLDVYKRQTWYFAFIVLICRI